MQELLALQAEINGQPYSRRCVVVTGDVSVEDDVREVFEEVVAQLGGVDIVRFFYTRIFHRSSHPIV